MPPWLTLLLFLVGAVLVVGLQAAGAMGNWRAFWTSLRQYGLYLLLAFAVPAVLVAGAMFIFNP